MPVSAYIVNMESTLFSLARGRLGVPLALAAYLLCPACPAQQDGHVSDESEVPAIVSRTHDFVDDAGGRLIGDITASLVYTPPKDDPTGAPELILRVVVSAIGPTVDGVVGYEGIRGGNVITAEQLEQLVSGFIPLDVVTVSTHGVTGRHGIEYGEVRVGQVGRIPMRRLRSDGRIDFDAVSREVPLELIIESGPLDDGEHHTVFEVAGLPRLQVVHSRDGGSGDIVQIDQPIVHPTDDVAIRAALERSREQTHLRGRALQDQPRVRAPRRDDGVDVVPADVVAWRALGVEVQWLRLVESLADSPDGWADWKEFLVREEAWQLLEWLAVSRPNGFASLGIGNALADADAPNWIRVAVWLMRNSFGHGGDAAKQLLASRDPGLVLGWLRAHPELRVRDAVALLEGELNGANTEPKDASAQWDPITLNALVAPMMNTPLALPVLASDGTEQADPDTLYVHQVVRAINAFIVATGDQYFRDQLAPDGVPWRHHYLNGVQHSHADIRQATFLGGTSLYGVIPFPTALSVVHLETEEDRVREAAMMCLSYIGGHPGIYAELIAVGVDYPHPAWKAAVSRLGDIGTEAAVEALRPLLVDQNISPDDRAFLQVNWNRLRTRLAKSNPTSFRELVEHAVWESANGGIGTVYRPTMTTLKARIDAGELTLAALEAAHGVDPYPNHDIYTSDFMYDNQMRDNIVAELIKYAKSKQ